MKTSPKARLIEAIEQGQIDQIEKYLPRVGPLNEIDIDDSSLIVYAASFDHPETVKFLLKKGANVNRVGANSLAALSTAIEKDLTEVATILVSNGADLNYMDYRGNTPLTLALRQDNEEIAKALVKHGANVNKIGAHGKTPLSWAVHCGRLAMVEFLIDNGALFTVHSAFLEAIAARNLEVVRFLHQKGAQVAHLRGYTPLIRAVETEHFEIAKYLVEQGANVNEMDAKKRTPLSVAAFKQDLRTFDYLVKAGADLSLASGKIEKIAELWMDFRIYLESLKGDKRDVWVKIDSGKGGDREAVYDL